MLLLRSDSNSYSLLVGSACLRKQTDVRHAAALKRLDLNPGPPDTKQLKVFFWGFKEDLIYLFQNKFFVQDTLLIYSCNPVVLYLADINYMAYPMLDLHLVQQYFSEPSEFVCICYILIYNMHEAGSVLLQTSLLSQRRQFWFEL